MPVRIRIYFRIPQYPSTGTNLVQILKCNDAAVDNEFSAYVSGNSGALVCRLSAQGTLVTTNITIATATTYILELAAYAGETVLELYNTSGVLLGSKRSATGFAAGALYTQVDIGARTISLVSSTEAFEILIDDVAVNDSNTYGNLHLHHNSQTIGPGTSPGFKQPNAAGAYAEFIGVGDLVNLYLNVDEWPPDGDTTYNHPNPAGVVLNRDAHKIADYSGSNTVRSVVIMFCAKFVLTSGDSLFGYYAEGDSTLRGAKQSDYSAGSVYIYIGVIIDEQPSGAALTNAFYNGIQPAYQRTAAQTLADSWNMTAITVHYEEGVALSSKSLAVPHPIRNQMTLLGM